MPASEQPESPRGLRVRSDLVIPESELIVRQSRSGGPGGQHVNKVSTRVEVWFNVRESSVLTEAQKQRIEAVLAPRITRTGALRVAASDTRSRRRNEEVARARLAALLESALRRRRARRPTRPTRASRQRRLDAKRRRGAVKHQRRRVRDEDV